MLQSIDHTVLAMAGLAALLIFLVGYTFLVPKTKKGFTPSNEAQQAENSQLRFFTAITNELMLALPASNKQLKAPPRDLKTESLLIRSGNPWNLTVSEYKTMKISGLVIGAIIGIPLGFLVGLYSDKVPVPAIMFMCALAGFTMPQSKLNDRAKKRELEFKRQLPEALDLISIALSGGLSFPRALAVSLPSMRPGVVRNEFELVSKDISAGATTSDALEKFALRAPSDSVKMFARAVQSALRTNAPLAEILAARAKASREEFFAYVNQKAAQLESKIWMILAPTMLPALMIITVLPSSSLLFGTL